MKTIEEIEMSMKEMEVVNTVRNNIDEDQSLVFQAIGEASMCWSNLPTGVFESTRAKQIAERILMRIDGLKKIATLYAMAIPAKDKASQLSGDDEEFLNDIEKGLLGGVNKNNSMYPNIERLIKLARRK